MEFVLSHQHGRARKFDEQPPANGNGIWMAPIGTIRHTLPAILTSLTKEQALCNNQKAIPEFEKFINNIKKIREDYQFRYDIFADKWTQLVQMIALGQCPCRSGSILHNKKCSDEF